MTAHGKIFTAKNRGMLWFCALGLLFSAVVLFFSIDIRLEAFLPDEETLDALRKEGEKAAAEAGSLRKTYQEMQTRREKALAMMDSWWHEDANGDYEVTVRERLEEIARKNEIRNPGFSTVRSVKINSMAFAIEIDVNFTSTLKNGLAFTEGVRELGVPVYWKRFEIRVDQRSGTLNWRGTLRIPAADEKAEERKK